MTKLSFTERMQIVREILQSIEAIDAHHQSPLVLSKLECPTETRFQFAVSRSNKQASDHPSRK